MKKHARKLSIVLTLVLILTSFGFTGAFAGDEAAESQDQVSTEQAALGEETGEEIVEEPAVVEEPAEEEPVVEEAAEPVEEEPVVEEAAEPVEEEPVVEEAAEPAEEEPVVEEQVVEEQAVEEPAAAAETEKTYTIKWMASDGTTVLRTDHVKEGVVPSYGKTPTRAGSTYFEYVFSKWSPTPVAATKDASYKAVYLAKKGIPKVPEVKTFSSYKSIGLEWAPVTTDKYGYSYTTATKNAINYKVRYKKGENGTYGKWVDVGTALKYHTPKNASGKYAFDPFSVYYFQVRAYIKGDEGNFNTAFVNDSPIRSIKYRLKISSGSTLKKHAGSGPSTYSLKGGVTIDTDRFQTGKYIFEYKGSIFYISQTRVSSAKAIYNKETYTYDGVLKSGTWNYSYKEAEYYVKDRGSTSQTSRLIFVNTYCQHAYYFKKDAGVWKCMDQWECATGLASTPTPTGNYGNKSIHDKLSSKNSIKYWSLFNGNAALHGTKPKDKRVGQVISNGCIRNPVAKAYQIYTYAPLKTKVLIV